MCGIAGLWMAARRDTLEDHTRTMTERLHHRGPDAGGVWVDADASVGLGHRRLSIVDLSERGAQPMHSDGGRYVLTFNGEIYNHLELRTELESEGEVPGGWRGHSDTETLLAGFRAWGVAPTLERCVGMFAFGLWDRLERRLTLGRDRFGEKPLYYGWVGPAFVFASELKAITALPFFDNPIDRASVALFMRFCAVPSPSSIHEGISKLDPGCLLTIDPQSYTSRSPAVQAYWRLDEMAEKAAADPYRDEAEADEALERTLRRAVAGQLVADVPVGAFLSGGVDSSLIVALMQAESTRAVKTFTVGFDEAGFDEAPHAAAVARHLGTDHEEVRVSARQAMDVVPRLPQIYDEPFADSSQIPTFIIAQVARRAVSVALSGDAGDELFGGYNRYLWAPTLWAKAGALPPAVRSMLATGLQAVPPGAWDAIGRLPGIRSRVASLGDKTHKIAEKLGAVNDVDGLYRSMVEQWEVAASPVLSTISRATKLDTWRPNLTDPVHRMMLLDAATYLPDDILTKVDRAAMATGLEARIPLLDHRVAEVAWRMPIEMKVHKGVGKLALRRLLYRHVPQALIERPKAGFAIPVGQWMRGPLKEWAEELLAPKRLSCEGYFDTPEIRRLWSEHLSGRRDWTVRLWNTLMFQAWVANRAR